MNRPLRIIVSALACSAVMTAVIALFFAERQNNWTISNQSPIPTGFSLAMTETHAGKPPTILWRNVAIVFSLHVTVFSVIFRVIMPPDSEPAAPHPICGACGDDLHRSES